MKTICPLCGGNLIGEHRHGTPVERVNLNNEGEILNVKETIDDCETGIFIICSECYEDVTEKVSTQVFEYIQKILLR